MRGERRQLEKQRAAERSEEDLLVGSGAPYPEADTRRCTPLAPEGTEGDTTARARAVPWGRRARCTPLAPRGAGGDTRAPCLYPAHRRSCWRCAVP